MEKCVHSKTYGCSCEEAEKPIRKISHRNRVDTMLTFLKYLQKRFVRQYEIRIYNDSARRRSAVVVHLILHMKIIFPTWIHNIERMGK